MFRIYIFAEIFKYFFLCLIVFRKLDRLNI
jgi:hypothetical protein